MSKETMPSNKDLPNYDERQQKYRAPRTDPGTPPSTGSEQQGGEDSKGSTSESKE